MKSKSIVLDCDGVLLNYNAAYPKVWKKAFGKELLALQPGAYHAFNEYGAAFEGEGHKQRFFAHFDEDAWSTMPALAGAISACTRLSEAGFQLICVSSMPDAYAKARQKNFQDLGFPIDTVIATGRVPGRNPKLETLRRLAPVAFVDDLADNFHGVDWGMHKALVDYGQADSPNRTIEPILADSTHRSLADFASWWLSR